MNAKTKRATAFFTVALIIGSIVFGNACGLLGCGNRAGSGTEDADKNKESESERAKRIVEKELSYLAPMYEDVEPLKYDSCTFTSVKENADGGHSVKGEIFYKDSQGKLYSQPYRAEVDKGSWAPRIVKQDIEKRE